MDWQRFLDENYVHYVTRGSNTKKGEVSIKCPMCGEDDPSEHMGINLTNGFWGCHRDPSHRGKSAKVLIKAMIGANSHTAEQIIKQYSSIDPDDLDSAIALLNPTLQEKMLKLNPAPEFNNFQLIKPRGVTKRFFTYLQNRGYENVQSMLGRYKLRCATVGKYKDRIIIPVYLNEELMGWTGRSMGSPKEAPRYLMSNQEIKTTIFNFDKLKEGGHRLIVTEGPFDAMKVDNASYTYSSWGNTSFRATCTFGTSVVPSQYALLRTLSKNYNETWVFFDQDADGPARELASWINAKIAYLPRGCKDPDSMSVSELSELGDVNFDGFFKNHIYGYGALTVP